MFGDADSYGEHRAQPARSGFACSPDAPIRVQLASQEANAAALLGDAVRAREALARAERAAESVTPDSGLSAWSFPVTRQAVFAQSVATQMGDADAMLRAASVADAAWSAGAPKVPANWAQIRVGAGIAHQYVKLARILRARIESGEYQRGDILPAADLACEYKVSIRVTYCALAMLAANRYVSRPGAFMSYSVTWQAGA